jgi:hypothetical protein
MKIFFYPQESRNPYAANFRQALQRYVQIVNDKPTKGSFLLNLTRYLFSADVYIFNWIENLPYLKFGKLQTLVCLLFMSILHIRKVRIIWLFHNIEPHFGKNYFSEMIYNTMLLKSSIIVTHSRDALKYLQGKTAVATCFFPHPIKELKIGDPDNMIYKPCDILIWGVILKYKGIKEFVQYMISSQNIHEYNIQIIGKCEDEKYDEDLKILCNGKISYENRSISSNELQSRLKTTKYVLFPYIGNSISSSGALIDTIVIGGGVPVGPNVGAFKDMKEENLCLTYECYDDIISILEGNQYTITKADRERFIMNNSWDLFVEKLLKKIYEEK